MAEEIRFTRAEDGTVTVDGFPEETILEPRCNYEPGVIRWDGDRVYLGAANGEATYLVAEIRESGDLLLSRLYARGPATEGGEGA